MTTSLRSTRRLCEWALLAALVACGGGGSSAPERTTSGLLPAPPIQGALLFDDATVLRPLQPGATWHYLGLNNDLTVEVLHENTVSHQAAGAGAVLETSTNMFKAGAGGVVVSISAGRVEITEGFALSAGAPVEPLTSIELRSPLRVGDQYTVIDRHIVDSGLDADGDGRSDAVDIAAYRVVRGIEQVELPFLAKLSAVRVDFITLARITGSATGQMSPVVQVVQRTWYMEGLGVIKRQSEVPNPNVPDFPSVHTEELQYGDLISRGIGGMPPLVAQVKTAPVRPGEVISASTIDAVALDDRIIALSRLNNDTVSLRGGLAFTALDFRGSVLAYRQYADPLYDPWRNAVGVVSVGPNFVLVYRSGANAPEARAVVFDPALNTQDPNGALLDLGPNVVGINRNDVLAVAGGANVVWVLWYHFDSVNFPNGQAKLMLRGFSGQGLALTPAYQLSDSAIVETQPLSASGVSAMVTWREGTNLTFRYATMSGFVQPPAIGTLSSTAAGSALPMAAATGQGPVVMWGSSLELPDTQDGRLRGVRLEGGAVVRGVPGPLDNELLDSAWLASGGRFSFPRMVSARQGKVVVLSGDFLTYRPTDPFGTTIEYALIFNPSTQALSTQASAAQAIVLPPVAVDGHTKVAQIVLPDRVIYVHNVATATGNTTATRLLWLH